MDVFEPGELYDQVYVCTHVCVYSYTFNIYSASEEEVDGEGGRIVGRVEVEGPE